MFANTHSVPAFVVQFPIEDFEFLLSSDEYETCVFDGQLTFAEERQFGFTTVYNFGLDR